ncbi:MAG: aminotransferase class V-fold PLP-dependent enzyme [Saprospiraceae bacterium]
MAFDVNKIRLEFPSLNQKINGNSLVYFDSAATSLKPKLVIDSLAEFYSTINSNVHRASHYLSALSTNAYEQARNKVAKFINAGTNEIVFTSGTTDSINTIANSLGQNYLKKSDEVIITVAEHHSNIVPWVELKEKIGIEIKVLNLNSSGELDVEELESLIGEKTKLISFCHTSNVMGIRNDIEGIMKIAKKHGFVDFDRWSSGYYSY